MDFWNKFQQRIIYNCDDPLDHAGNLSYWRNHLFAHTLSYIIPLISFLLLPSLVYCFVEEYFLLMFLNVSICLITVLVAFIPNLHVSHRKIIFISFVFIHSIILLIYMGDFGGGLIYLMAVSIFFITIFPNKFALLPVFVNLFFGISFSFIVKYDLIILHSSVRGKVLEWLVTFLSMVVLVAVFSFLLPRLFASMQATIDSQKVLQNKLNQKNVDLLKSEDELRVLNAELEIRVEKRTKDLKELNQQLETFSYSISHDLQAPIRAINIFTLALEKETKGTLTDNSKDLLKNIVNSTLKMKDLIQSLLNFSQINKLGISKKVVDTNAIIKAVWINLTHQYNKEIEFNLQEVPKVNGDKILLQQVFENLLSNAIKYSSNEETPSIELGYSKKDKTFYIKDNGVGFDMKGHNRMFNIFKRLHTEEEFEGTGVGLSIVRMIVEKHGGKVWAESEKGKGATFYFTLAI